MADRLGVFCCWGVLVAVFAIFGAPVVAQVVYIQVQQIVGRRHSI
jgi:hypothetical protein